ncbi:MBL fold metallo-hydrolase [Neobacillus sp. D3-1R]|uniref:MBL fold metallo-hydrolase n=1 Tax=Neobacillus sp. D3-1R TaxID=3445778 RepID=UPI003F9F7520
MFIQKLSWAGIKVSLGTTSILIDPIENPKKFFQLGGNPKENLIKFSDLGEIAAILITHLHDDHFDPESIIETFGTDIPVYVSYDSVKEVKKSKLTNVIGVGIGESLNIEELQITATWSMDGFGSEQVAWIVEGGTQKIIHCGDTLWHGYWWKIERLFGPFDMAFLPINGAEIDIPIMEASGQIACMNPEQAVSAANLLKAKTLVPIHYKTFDNPPYYKETTEMMDRLFHAAQNSNINLALLETMEVLNLNHPEKTDRKNVTS